MTEERHDAWHVSPISLRILAVNIAALMILGLGMLYTGQYEREMITSELKALQVEGRLLAAALAEGGVRETLDGDPVLAEDLSRQMLRKLVEDSDLHTILFSKSGLLLLDSRQLRGPGGAVQIEEMDSPFKTWGFMKKTSYFLQKALEILPTRLDLPPYPQNFQGIETYPNLMPTLRGASFTSAWRGADGHILLSVSLPVQKLKNVLGAVLLTRSGANIEQAVHGVQITVMKLFLWALLTTIMLSIYLSETIGAPILRLADASAKVGESLYLKDSIPDFSYRNDEIGVLSAALRSMTAALAERIDAIGNFAADVAHEIKNPLASLKSAVETLSVVKDLERQEKLLSIIADDINRLNRLITDISMASRMDAELNKAKKTTFDLAGLLQSIVEHESEDCGLRGRMFLNLNKSKKLWVTGNEAQLGQVMHNLIANAASFLAENGKITISGSSQGSKIIIYVENEGPPIPEKKLETVFERFYSERPESEKFGLHSGLGLSISRQIIRAHRGTIFANNTRDGKGRHHGVRFTIILPEGAAT